MSKDAAVTSTEDIPSYVKRLRDLASGRDPFQTLRATPAEIEQLTRYVPPSLLIVSPAPQKWSVNQIVAHLADSELVTGFRLRQISSSADGVQIPAYDQDAWASLCHYEDIPLDESLELFTLLRRSNLRVWESLSHLHFCKFGLHSERGQESLEDLLALITGHDINHLAQIRAIVAA